jgi:hypothetical protein
MLDGRSIKSTLSCPCNAKIIGFTAAVALARSEVGAANRCGGNGMLRNDSLLVLQDRYRKGANVRGN